MLESRTDVASRLRCHIEPESPRCERLTLASEKITVVVLSCESADMRSGLPT